MNSNTKKNDPLGQDERTEYQNFKAAKMFLNKEQSRLCPLRNIPDSEIHYRNIKLLIQYCTESLRIQSVRVTGVSKKKHKLLRIAIKRARSMNLI